jgi:general secretion pathway protein F
MIVEAITRQLALLLENEIKLTEALNITIEEVADKKVVLALRDIRDRVANGSSVADAMEPHQWLFGHMYLSMVRVGETAGTLPEVLRNLADFLRQQSMRQGQLGAVMIYPVVMVVVMSGIVIFLMTSVLPQLREVIESFGNELPLPTRILMGASSFMTNHWLLLIALAVGFGALITLFLKTDRGRRLTDRVFMRIPVVNELVRKTQTSHFTNTLQILLSSGVKMADCMAVLKETTSNSLMKDTISDLQESILRGSDVSAVLRRSRIIPRAVAHMVAVGEQSGELETVLKRLSANMVAEVDITINKLNALMQPVIILAMAAVVGLIVASVMLPIMQMSNLESM